MTDDADLGAVLGADPGADPGAETGVDLESGIESGIGSGIESDLRAIERQLGRVPRGMAGVAHRCPCGQPDVVRTAPRLPDGTPFPTTYYATYPQLTAAVSTLETLGVMRDMQARLATDPDLAAAYRRAHTAYLADRAALGDGDVPEIDGISAGGMPERVKCLHVLVAHALAAGPGINPLGDEALAMLPTWWATGPCVGPPADSPSVSGGIIGA